MCNLDTEVGRLFGGVSKLISNKMNHNNRLLY